MKTSQDARSIAQMVEDVCSRLKSLGLRNVHFRSDNAGMYVKSVLLMLTFFQPTTELQVSSPAFPVSPNGLEYASSRGASLSHKTEKDNRIAWPLSSRPR